MKKLLISLVLSSIALTGCMSTTNLSDMGVKRKQLLLVSSQEVHQLAGKAYGDALQEAQRKNSLNTDPQLKRRLEKIANNLIPQTALFRPDALEWKWEVNVIKSNELNAFCAGEGKIVFYTGIVDRLKLSDDEIAAIMGHEMAHALREHSRESISRGMLQQAGVALLVNAGGLGEGGAQIAMMLGELGVGLPNSRAQENEADLIGLELMTRAGYNPNAAVSLWQKMSAESKGEMPQILSTHPNSDKRILAIQAQIPKLIPIYSSRIQHK